MWRTAASVCVCHVPNVNEFLRRPQAFKAAKAALNAWERGGRDKELEQIREFVKDCFDSDDYKEGRRAFKEKRTPDFLGR